MKNVELKNIFWKKKIGKPKSHSGKDIMKYRECIMENKI